MKVIITGGSGFIGSYLTSELQQKGHDVVIFDLVPPRSNVSFVKIDLLKDLIDKSLFSGVDGVIHLAGVNIFGRWTKEYKKMIYDSRIISTRNIITALKNIRERPAVFISASAVGIYGNRGEEELTEELPPGDDFLSHVCIDWEKESIAGDELGLRTVQVRTAPVLGKGGVLNQVLPIFKIGLGGQLGTGKQWFPWIHIKDIVGTYIFALENKNVFGPINSCSTHQIRNKEFVHTLARILNRPSFVRTPAFVLKTMLGEVAEVVLASQKASPAKLLHYGYNFSFPNLTDALYDIFKHNPYKLRL